MGGVPYIDDEWGILVPSSSEQRETRTVVMVGKVGNGKSGTGNSILGAKEFISKPSSVGVTGTCQMRTTVLEDGMALNVIDTPGLLDFSREPEFLRKEILKCITKSKDGIHAVLFVLTVRSRFSVEEKCAVENLLDFFGHKISDYMIVVFTGGDELDDSDETLDSYLDNNCPDELKEILEVCGNRYILFDNKTKDENKKSNQLNMLLSFVNDVVENNGGNPFTNELFMKLQEEANILRERAAQVNSLKECSEQQFSEFKEQFRESYQRQFKGWADAVDSKLNETTYKLKLELAEEKAARLRVELDAKATQTKFDEEMRLLTEKLAKANRDTEELRNKSNCAIM